jgi:hypothetical protein
MKVEIPELAWHFDLESTTSIDFHPDGEKSLLAVAGSD